MEFASTQAKPLIVLPMDGDDASSAILIPSASGVAVPAERLTPEQLNKLLSAKTVAAVTAALEPEMPQA